MSYYTTGIMSDQVYIIEGSVCSQNQLSTRLACTAQVARLIQPYIVLTTWAIDWAGPVGTHERIRYIGLEALYKVGAGD